MTHLWCSVYLPHIEYLNHFHETLISLTQEPIFSIFCISGLYSEQGIELIQKYIKSYKILHHIKATQYEGFKYIALEYNNIPRPEYIILLDADDIVANNRIQTMEKTIKYYNKSIITIAAKFYNDININEFDDSLNILIPLALENHFIKPNDDKSYYIIQPFVCGEDTCTLIFPFNIIYDYILNLSLEELKNNYADVEFYKYLISNNLILFVPFDYPVYYYRIWDRPNKISLHHF